MGAPTGPAHRRSRLREKSFSPSCDTSGSCLYFFKLIIIINGCLETGSHHVAQAGLELVLLLSLEIAEVLSLCA